jgi:NAD+ synthase (glutamine-hydrolysing)
MTADPEHGVEFGNIYAHGYIRGAVCVPRVRIADPTHNLERTLALARRAHEQHAGLALFPELGLSAYSNDDLFHQDALLDGVLGAVAELVAASREVCPVLVVGAPLRFEGKLFNCGLVVHRGRLLGIVPKTYIPNYREFYEKRQFTSGRDAVAREVTILGERVPFGSDLIFDATDLPGLSLHVEICEDLWAPVPPSTYAALAGATVVANLSASNIIIGKADYRKDLCAAQSGKCIAAYLYAAAGQGESTTDLAWDGHALIYENNELLAEGARFSDDEQLIVADLDLERLAQDRMRMTTFNDAVGDHLTRVQAMRRVPFTFSPPRGTIPLTRPLDRFPYVPSDARARDERCYEAYNIQVHGLMQRLRATGIRKLVIGVSGGLDSTQALIVAAKAMDRLGLPRSNILGYTMPGFATSEHTRANAWKLMRALGVSAEEIDIRPSAVQMLRDIGHPAADGAQVFDITYENVQAGERTSHLFRLANRHGALVVGTGDLSELALGWATYGVGDHMSHYNVNASVPKTLIQYLIRWAVATSQFDAETSGVLTAILATAISPELVPSGAHGSDQRTEDVVGPYDLQDFHLYFVSRYGFRPSKVAFIAYAAWGDPDRGAWPDGIPADARHAYDLPAIRKWLEVFLHRFFEVSQFKRSAMPNGPKVGSGGSLSPRGDWRAPSDASARPWIDELRANMPDGV